MQIRANSGQLRVGVVRRQAVELYRGSSNDRDDGREHGNRRQHGGQRTGVSEGFCKGFHALPSP